MILYLDTSSLVKLYVAEAGSDDVRTLVERAAVVATSQLAYPEVRAALARRRREGTLRPRDFTVVKRDFETDWPTYLAIDVTAAICQKAGDFAERYRLRGFDSVHLASFAEMVRGVGKAEARFSSHDQRLNRAATALARTLTRSPPAV
jgi:predicted nucleic acid-binding protein